MKYQNILVPYDRSDSAKRALATALDLSAYAEGAQVTVFFAAPMPEFASTQFQVAERISGAKRMTQEDMDKLQEDYLAYERDLIMSDLPEAFDGACSDAGEFKVVMGQGKPSKAILDYAADNAIDLIIMGSRGLNAVAGMLGSVSYAVLRNAPCPVLVEK